MANKGFFASAIARLLPAADVVNRELAPAYDYGAEAKLAQLAATGNILIHGPPGTGKTELARTLAEGAGLALHGVGEADDDGEEPDRWERVAALQLAQRMLAPAAGAVLLFDEMEDLIGDAKPSVGDWVSGGRAARSSSTACWKPTRCR